MTSSTGIIKRIKIYCNLNRTKFSNYGVYQIFFFIYKRYNSILARYYSLGKKNVQCTVCGYIGRKYLKDGICPQCWSFARHRLLALYIQKVKRLPPNSWILDIAPNIATSYIFERSFYPNYVSVDFDSPVAEIHMDLTNLGFKKEIFDFIVCYHVLEHIKDDTKAIQELYRVLKLNGTAILQVPFSGENDRTFESDLYDSNDRAMNLKHYGHPTHVRRYGKIDYLSKLKSSCFAVLMDNYINTFSDHELIKYGLDKKEILYVCSKKGNELK